MVITVSGTSGSGTTTLCKKLEKKYGLRYLYGGQIFRDLAKEHDMTIVEFGEFVKSKPETDLMVDQKFLDEAKIGDVILEGRLSGYMLNKSNVPAIKVLLTVSLEERKKRVAGREMITEEEAEKRIMEREKANWERYENLYGVSKDNEDWYDIVVDTSRLGVLEVFEAVVAGVERLQHNV